MTYFYSATITQNNKDVSRLEAQGTLNEMKTFSGGVRAAILALKHDGYKLDMEQIEVGDKATPYIPITNNASK